MQGTVTRLLTRTALVGIAATVALAGASTPVTAHVTVSAPDTTAGSYTLLTFGVPHGCDGAATTEVAIQIPEPIHSVTPTVNPGWDVEKRYTALDEPIVDSHGNEVTERVSEVVYTAHQPLPDDLRDAFALSLRLPEETAGRTLHFPAIQTCTEGEHAWIQIAADGQDRDDLDEPAPFIEVAAPAEADAGAEEPADEAAGAEAAASDSSDPLVIVALALGASGALLGAVSLFQGRPSA